MKFILIALSFSLFTACSSGTDTQSNDQGAWPADIEAQVLSPYGASSGSGRASCNAVHDDIIAHIDLMTRQGHDPHDIYSVRIVNGEDGAYTRWWRLYIRGDKVTVFDSPKRCGWEWSLL